MGTRWRIRKRTFAHVLTIEAGWPPAYARAAATDGPCTVLTFRSTAQSERQKRLAPSLRASFPLLAPPAPGRWAPSVHLSVARSQEIAEFRDLGHPFFLARWDATTWESCSAPTPTGARWRSCSSRATATSHRNDWSRWSNDRRADRAPASRPARCTLRGHRGRHRQCRSAMPPPWTPRTGTATTRRTRSGDAREPSPREACNRRRARRGRAVRGHL